MGTEEKDTGGGPPTYFVSGHLDLTKEEFEEHYVPRLREAFDRRARFVVGDAPGCDFMAQRWLVRAGVPARSLSVFHMLERPRHAYGTGFGSHDARAAESAPARITVESIGLVGGFSSDEERDAAMTASSTHDIAWVRDRCTCCAVRPCKKKRRSGTAKNLERRVRVNRANAEAAELMELTAWPRYRMAQNEAWPVYSAAEADPELGEDGTPRPPAQGSAIGASADAYDLVPLPPELVARYEAARAEFWACQRELERHWTRWQDRVGRR